MKAEWISSRKQDAGNELVNKGLLLELKRMKQTPYINSEDCLSKKSNFIVSETILKDKIWFVFNINKYNLQTLKYLKLSNC